MAVSMDAHEVQLIGFDDDDALDEIFSGFRLFSDYKSFLLDHLTEILRKQHPTVELRSVELLGQPNCELGGMPSPDNQEQLIIDTTKIPLELRIRLSTTGDDLHELTVTLVINAVDVQTTPKITSDMSIRAHRTTG